VGAAPGVREDAIEFRLLGPLEVRAGGGAVELGRPKQRELLVLLLLHANRVVSRERLVDSLWGEDPPPTAVKAVQWYVSQLRKLLPDGMLLTRAPGYLLEVEPDTVDLLRFERLVAEARSSEPERAAGLLREALALWRGPPLAEFTQEEFARIEAGRLEDVRLAALEERIDADLALGRHGEVTAELEALVAEHPRRERLTGQLMLALYRSGRQAEALGAYREARAALEEVGLEPGPELRQLERKILNQDPALAPAREPAATAVLPGALVPAPAFPFVGRTRELETLRSLLARAARGEGGVVLVGGEAGGGKTRLVRELAHEAASGGARVLYGTSDAAVSVPYQPLREWLEFLVRVSAPGVLAEHLGERAALLVPGLAGAGAPPELDRHALQSAICDALGRLSLERPLVLVADDLHWADAETLHLLPRLATTAPETRLLVLAAYRDRGEEHAPAFAEALAELTRLDGVTRLSLGRLTTAEVADFIRASAGAEAAGDLVSAIGDLTGGTPLLLCELWRDLRERGAVDASGGRVELRRRLAELRGPERLRDVLRHRLSRLDPGTAELLELAAVAGPRFELRVLAGASPLDQPAFAAAVAEAIRTGLIEELPDPVPAARFAHELVRRVVYDRVTGIERAGLHLRVGEALERVHGSDTAPVVPELAHHFTLAAPVGGVERAVAYNFRAADAALAAAAFEEAAARLSTALELGIADPRERARTEVELGYLLNEMGRPSEAGARLAASLDAATGLEERGIVARALVARIGHRMGDPGLSRDEMLGVTEAAVDTLTRLGDSRGAAVARRYLGIAHQGHGAAAAATEELERALLDADASGDQATRRMVVGTLCNTLCLGPAPAGVAISRCNELLHTARDDHVLEAVIGRFLSLLVAMTGRADEARELIRTSSLVLDEVNQNSYWVYRWAVAEARTLIGDRAGAERDLAAQWAWFRDVGHPAIDERAMQAAYRLALLHCEAGRWDEAESCLAYGRDVALPRTTATATNRLAAEALVAAHRGPPAEALPVARAAVEGAETTDNLNLRARMWLALADVQRAAAEPADAAVTEALRLYEAKGNVAAAASVRAAAT
jgi:DNA-binding SARP family transcriptional activator